MFRPNKPKNGGITAGISRAGAGRDAPAAIGSLNSADSGAEVSSGNASWPPFAPQASPIAHCPTLPVTFPFAHHWFGEFLLSILAFQVLPDYDSAHFLSISALLQTFNSPFVDSFDVATFGY